MRVGVLGRGEFAAGDNAEGGDDGFCAGGEAAAAAFCVGAALRVDASPFLRSLPDGPATTAAAALAAEERRASPEGPGVDLLQSKAAGEELPGFTTASPFVCASSLAVPLEVSGCTTFCPRTSLKRALIRTYSEDD